MEILKKIVVTILFLSGINFCNTLFSQNTPKEAFSKSYTLEGDRQYTSAIAVLKNLNVDTYAVNLRLGWLYYLDGKYKTALSHYAKAIQLRPSSVEARLGYVLPAAKLKDWSKVGLQYDAILKLDPNNYKANYYRGLMFYNVGNYKSAATYFDKIEHLYPFDYDIVIVTAWNSFYLKEIEKARILFNQALLIQPSSASALEGLSLCEN